MAQSVLGGDGNGGLAAEPPYPPVDIIDRGEVLLLRARVPGLPKEDLEVSVESTWVLLRGRGRLHEEPGRFFQHERAPGHFERTIELPVAIDADRTHAHLENGILELTLPKRHPTHPRRVEVH